MSFGGSEDIFSAPLSKKEKAALQKKEHTIPDIFDDPLKRKSQNNSAKPVASSSLFDDPFAPSSPPKSKEISAKKPSIFDDNFDDNSVFGTSTEKKVEENVSKIKGGDVIGSDSIFGSSSPSKIDAKESKKVEKKSEKSINLFDSPLENPLRVEEEPKKEEKKVENRSDPLSLFEDPLKAEEKEEKEEKNVENPVKVEEKSVESEEVEEKSIDKVEKKEEKVDNSFVDPLLASETVDNPLVLEKDEEREEKTEEKTLIKEKIDEEQTSEEKIEEKSTEKEEEKKKESVIVPPLSLEKVEEPKEEKKVEQEPSNAGKKKRERKKGGKKKAPLNIDLFAESPRGERKEEKEASSAVSSVENEEKVEEKETRKEEKVEEKVEEQNLDQNQSKVVENPLETSSPSPVEEEKIEEKKVESVQNPLETSVDPLNQKSEEKIVENNEEKDSIKETVEDPSKSSLVEPSQSVQDPLSSLSIASSSTEEKSSQKDEEVEKKEEITSDPLSFAQNEPQVDSPSKSAPEFAGFDPSGDDFSSSFSSSLPTSVSIAPSLQNLNGNEEKSEGNQNNSKRKSFVESLFDEMQNTAEEAKLQESPIFSADFSSSNNNFSRNSNVSNVSDFDTESAFSSPHSSVVVSPSLDEDEPEYLKPSSRRASMITKRGDENPFSPLYDPLQMTPTPSFSAPFDAQKEEKRVEKKEEQRDPLSFLEEDKSEEKSEVETQGIPIQSPKIEQEEQKESVPFGSYVPPSLDESSGGELNQRVEKNATKEEKNLKIEKVSKSLFGDSDDEDESSLFPSFPPSSAPLIAQEKPVEKAEEKPILEPKKVEEVKKAEPSFVSPLNEQREDPLSSLFPSFSPPSTPQITTISIPPSQILGAKVEEKPQNIFEEKTQQKSEEVAEKEEKKEEEKEDIQSKRDGEEEGEKMAEAIREAAERDRKGNQEESSPLIPKPRQSRRINDPPPSVLAYVSRLWAPRQESAKKISILRVAEEEQANAPLISADSGRDLETSALLEPDTIDPEAPLLPKKANERAFESPDYDVDIEGGRILKNREGEEVFEYNWLPREGGFFKKQPVRRINFIDANRGAYVFCFLLFVFQGSSTPEEKFDLFTTTNWTGLNNIYFLFSLFLFLVGTSIPVSFNERSKTSPTSWLRIILRTIILLAVGFGLNVIRSGFAEWVLVPIPNEYGFIAMAYLFSSVLHLFELNWTRRVIVLIFLIMSLTIELVLFVPDCGQGYFTPQCNAVTFIDKKLLGTHKYPIDVYGPFNLFNALFLVNVGLEFGRFTLKDGMILRLLKFIAIIFFTGIIGFGISYSIPIVVSLWTLSFTLIATAIGGGLYFVSFVIIEIPGSRSNNALKRIKSATNFLFSPFIWLSRNSFLLILLGIIFRAVCEKMITWEDGKKNLWWWFYRYLFLSWVQDKRFASLLMTIPLVATAIGVSYFFSRRTILVRQ
eukprot:TRINITY_DN1925_c0_g4_i2.p1 TRINITY_DN1925_c0_g4~~TRINITY_DN1925_c0_g4_i2.p1  ORF type:complete len:1442 (-),score=692.88 TRINITY_DN1925_c0_g4_i2:22-4347(-)